jgi:hypothetical protein
MVVGGSRGWTVHFRSLDVPGGSLVKNSIVIAALVASAGAGTLVSRLCILFLLNGIRGWEARSRRSGARARARASRTSSGLRTFAPRLGGLVGGNHGGVEGCEVAHHALILFLLIGMDGLCMLAQVVQTRKLFATVTCERTFPSMFSGKTR